MIDTERQLAGFLQYNLHVPTREAFAAMLYRAGDLRPKEISMVQFLLDISLLVSDRSILCSTVWE